jgi:hypothetical protein
MNENDFASGMASGTALRRRFHPCDRIDPTRALEVFAPFLVAPPADPADQPGEVELGVST